MSYTVMHDGQTFGIGDKVTVPEGDEIYGAEITEETIGWIQDITDEDRLYVVFDEVEYVEPVDGSRVTCSGFYDAEQLEKW